MIRLGLRLTVSGGREAAVRLILIAAAVALGVGLVLMSLAGINAVNKQNARYAWLGTGTVPASPTGSASTSTTGQASAADPLWWLLQADHFAGQTIARVDVAATGPDSPVPPGIPRLPGPGQFYASPALSALLHSIPAGELGDRFPGHQIGTIGAAALPAPNSLIIIIGHTASQLSHLQLSHVPGATEVRSISATSPSSCNGSNCAVGAGINANGIDLILSVVACALLFPVLIFIGTATRLSAARREQRFAAIRLVGATPRQVSVISAVESTVAAVAGVAAGFGLFFLLRTPLAAVPFTGAPFFPSDLSLSAMDVLAVAIGVPLAAAAAARLALRRVQISPLGVTRQVTPRAPRAWRLIPLLAGLAELAYFAAAGHPGTTGGQIQAFLPGFLLIMVGLVIAGPWLTMVAARVLARRAHRPATLIASRRLADNPRAGFRAVSGLVLALFVTAVAVGVITTIVANRGAPSGGAAASDTLTAQLGYGQGEAIHIQGRSASAPVSHALLTKLHFIQGVQAVALIHANPLGIKISAAKMGLRSSFGHGAGRPDLVRAALPYPAARALPGRGSGRGDPVCRFPRAGSLSGRNHLARRRYLRAAPAARRCPGDLRGHERVDIGDRAGPHHTGARLPRSAFPAHHDRRVQRADQPDHPRVRAARRSGHPRQPADRRLHPGRERGRLA